MTTFRHIRISQIFWSADPEDQDWLAEQFRNPTGDTRSAWVRGINDRLMEKGLVKSPLSPPTIQKFRDEVLRQTRLRLDLPIGGRTATPTRQDVMTCLLPQEKAEQYTDRTKGLGQNPETIESRRALGKEVEVFYDLSASVTDRMEKAKVGYPVARQLHFEALREAKGRIVADGIEKERQAARMEFHSTDRADRYMLLLLNKGIPSDLIDAVLIENGDFMAAEMLLLKPEDRLPLLLLSGANQFGAANPSRPKRLLEEDYEGVVGALAHWLSTGDSSEMPDRLKTWARITD